MVNEMIKTQESVTEWAKMDKVIETKFQIHLNEKILHQTAVGWCGISYEKLEFMVNGTIKAQESVAEWAKNRQSDWDKIPNSFKREDPTSNSRRFM